MRGNGLKQCQSLLWRVFVVLYNLKVEMLQVQTQEGNFFPATRHSRPPSCAVLALPVTADCQLLAIRPLYHPPSLGLSSLQNPSPVTSNLRLQLRKPFLVLWNSSSCEMVDFCRCSPGLYFQVRSDSQNKSTSLSDPSQDEREGLSRCYLRLSGSYRRGESVYFYFRSKELPQLKILSGQLTRLSMTQFDIMKQYTPVRKLGKSGVAGVFLYQCLLKGTQESRCVKSFMKTLYFQQYNGLGKTALRRQIEVMTKCDHENICRFEGLFEGENTVYLVMKHYPMTLLQFLRELTPSRTLTILRDLLQGLAYLHSLGIMHRDLKLENIVVESTSSLTPRAAIIDFGVAEYFNSPTYLFAKCGTSGYIAPQAFLPERSAAPEKTDIFSLGVVFFIMLFRRHLFAGQTEIDILNNNKLARFDATPSDFASLPLHTQDLLQKMLELDASKRISAAEALQHRVFASVGGEERAEGEGEGEQVVSEAKPTG